MVHLKIPKIKLTILFKFGQDKKQQNLNKVKFKIITNIIIYQQIIKSNSYSHLQQLLSHILKFHSYRYYKTMFAVHNMGFTNQHTNRKDSKTGEEVYFEGSKKNQLNDLKKYMKSIVADPQKEYYRKQIIKKIISYTTSGIDTSRLYPEIVMASATKDIIEKKLIYLYLSIYSANNQQFARMAINTYLKDISSPNPNIRTLAARSLSNLRFKGRDEYAVPAFQNGLNDFVPGVKRSCMLGLAKIAVQHNRGIGDKSRDEGLLSKFYQLLRDEDTTLVCTALQAINQVQQQGISMSRKLAFYLLSNLHRYTDIQLPVVVGYLQLYDPKNDQQIIEILTILQPRLKSSNSAVVLSISKVFIKMGHIKQDLKLKLLKTLRKSLLSFLHNEVPEIQYVVLRHIQYIISTLKTDIFNTDYKNFIVGGNQPTYLKANKIRLLRLCSGKHNFADVISQFAEYLFDEDISKNSVEALTEMLLDASENEAKFIAKTIIKTIQTAPIPIICNNVVPLVSAYLRLYPRQFPLFATSFYLLNNNSQEQDSRCSILQLIGDFGQFIEDAPELIVTKGGELTDKLKISLLRAATKLFLKRPSQVLDTLSNLLKKTLSDDETHLQVKDYAAYLYRGLQAGVQQFKQLFLQQRPQQKSVRIDMVQLQFNSLQIIYASKSQKWIIDPMKYLQQQEIPLQDEPNGQQLSGVQHHQIQVDLQSKFKKLQVQNFDITFVLTTDQFQKCWQQYDVGSSITRVVTNIDILNQQLLQELFKMWNITVLASAQTDQEIKFYNYCRIQTENGNLGITCMECCFQKLPETMTLMIKSDDDQLAGFVSRYIQDILRLNEII